MSLRLSRLDASFPIATPDGRPTQQFMRFYNSAVQKIEQAFADIEAAQTAIVQVNEQQQESIEAIEAAQAAADAANAAAAAADAAAATAQAEASSAAAAASQANSLIEDIEAGELDLSAVKVSGQRFINNGGVLEAEV